MHEISFEKFVHEFAPKNHTRFKISSKCLLVLPLLRRRVALDPTIGNSFLLRLLVFWIDRVYLSPPPPEGGGRLPRRNFVIELPPSILRLIVVFVSKVRDDDNSCE